MYSVLRFSFSKDSVDIAQNIGQNINLLFPGAFDGFDKVECRFSCSISQSNDLLEHLKEIEGFIEKLKSILRFANEHKFLLELDFALEIPESISYESVSFDLNLLGLLASHKISLTITAYPNISNIVSDDPID
jgi:hypothetical protein